MVMFFVTAINLGTPFILKRLPSIGNGRKLLLYFGGATLLLPLLLLTPVLDPVVSSGDADGVGDEVNATLRESLTSGEPGACM